MSQDNVVIYTDSCMNCNHEKVCIFKELSFVAKRLLKETNIFDPEELDTWLAAKATVCNFKDIALVGVLK